MENPEDGPFRIGSTIRALSSAVRGQQEGEAAVGKLWFKESSSRNLQNRDFLSPGTVLGSLFTHGQVPPAILAQVVSVHGGGVLPMCGAEQVEEGLRLRVDRADVFQKVLQDASNYLLPTGKEQGCVVLNCPCLYAKQGLPCPDSLSLAQLRAVLVCDHQGALLRKQGMSVSFCPVLPEGSNIVTFLQSLGVDWPTVSGSPSTRPREAELWETLHCSPYREEGTTGVQIEDGEAVGVLRINLKKALQEKKPNGYDPNLGTYTVRRERVHQLAQLDAAVSGCQGPVAAVLHVVCSQDEFRQQQVDVLWRVAGTTVTQKHLVCGPVKTSGAQLSANQYFQLRRIQMKEASEMKYREQVEGQSWEDIIRVMTSATVRFELLSTVHTSPVTLDMMREGGLSTKGPRGGVFVMYNCARLHTLFSSYERAVEQGVYPQIPDVCELDFSSLKEEGEWLLLFNYLLPFSELLEQTGQPLEHCGGGARVILKTERVCKFLVSLTKDFSSYYNRVHILGEPLPHLFNQMFCRLLLLRALRELYHCALDTLHLPPIRQL